MTRSRAGYADGLLSRMWRCLHIWVGRMAHGHVASLAGKRSLSVMAPCLGWLAAVC